jgi:hypothetical protein
MKLECLDYGILTSCLRQKKSRLGSCDKRVAGLQVRGQVDSGVWIRLSSAARRRFEILRFDEANTAYVQLELRYVVYSKF